LRGLRLCAAKEYVVFVRERLVGEDVFVDVAGEQLELPEIWKGALPVGQKILIGEICTQTIEMTSDARLIIRQLNQVSPRG
jgi:hypothetical protein